MYTAQDSALGIKREAKPKKDILDYTSTKPFGFNVSYLKSIISETLL